MASAGSVRAGGAFVEIFARDTAFQRAMSGVQARLRTVGAAMQQFGTKMMLAGTAAGLPLVLAARQAATFEDAILGMSAAAGLSAEEVGKLQAESLRLSREMGVSPEKIANAMLELAKAGMSVNDVLNGAARSAVEFSRVSGVEMADAAVFMKVAMNSFGVSAVEAVDTLSAAADASETSIAAMVESFALVGSAGALFSQSLFDVSQGLAVLARFGIRGEEAGTGIKTMLVRLTSPSKEASDALAKIGLSVNSFRDAKGNLLPLVQIVGVLEKALKGVDNQVRDQVLTDVFGDRGIRVIGAFLNVGTAGFVTMADAMESNLPVSAKFQILMSGLSGAFEKLNAAVKRLSIAFAVSLGDSVNTVASSLAWIMDMLAMLIQRFPVAAKIVAGVVAGIFALGAAAILAGVAMKVMAAGIAVVTAVVLALSTTIGALVAILVGGVTLALVAAYQLSPAFRKEVKAIMAAIGNLDFSTAWRIMVLNLSIALVQMGQAFENAWAGLKNTAAAAGMFIGDKLVEGLDRFLGWFGSSIIDLQGKLEKLGIYFRSAFNFSWATGELQKQLAAVDARLAREKQRAPTADARAQDRRDERDAAAKDRQRANDARNAGYNSTIEALRDELDAERRKTMGEKPAAKTSAKRSDPRDPRVDGPPGDTADVKAAETAKAPQPATLSTFAADIAGQIGIGPELDYAAETAKNTKRAADALETLIGTGDFGKGGIKAFDPAAIGTALASASSSVTAPVAAADRDMLSASEKTAAAAERMAATLDRIARASGGGLAFA